MTGKMRCPFRMAAFDQPDTCDEKCAWLTDGECAVHRIARDSKNAEFQAADQGFDEQGYEEVRVSPSRFEHEWDSREKLEADARELQARIWQAGANSDGISLSHIIELLDRQAAITERYWMEICGASANANLELKRQIDELTAERDKLREKVRHQSRQLTDTQNALENRNEEIKPRWKRDTKKLQSRIDVLTSERDEWKAKAEQASESYLDAKSSRDELREKLGRIKGLL